MPFTAKVQIQKLVDQEFYLLDEIYPSINTSNLTLTFVMDHMKNHHITNLLNSGQLKEITEQLLLKMGKCSLYKEDNKSIDRSIIVTTIYVIDEKIKLITEDEMKKYKMTQFIVPISKRKRQYKIESNDENDRSKPLCKKKKT